MVLNTSDNVKYYFQHASMMPIPGHPNYKTLSQIQKEVRANGRPVPCGLVGGHLGHLGLVTPVTTYTRINTTVAFNRPDAHLAPTAHVQ